MNKTRITYLDLLRVLSIFAVITIHVVALKWYSTPVNTFNWQTLNIYDSISRFAVPLFIMLSGAMMLSNDKEYSVKTLYQKKIFRLITAFIFFSFIYAIYHAVRDGYALKTFLYNLIYGEYHMWFIFMIIGLYVITPFLKKITSDLKLTEYFLLVSFIVTMIIPNLIYIPYFGDNISIWFMKFNLTLPIGFVFYYVWGYYLTTKKISKPTKKMIYSLGLISLLLTIVLTSYYSLKLGYPVEKFYNYLLPTTGVYTTAIFIFFQNQNNHNYSDLTEISHSVFGIYLVHALVINILDYIGLSSISFNSIVAVPLVTLITFLISYGIILLIKRYFKYYKYIT